MNTFIKGADLSSLLDVEAAGGVFCGDPKADAMALLKGYGVNLVRLRLWNDPYSAPGAPYGAGTSDLARTMTLARRARALGLPWLLDFHYSDFWADPGKQTTPKAWQGYGEDQLEKAVYDYTFAVMTVLREENLLPAMVAPGNEVSNGLLWPTGKRPNWKNIVRYMGAGIRAVRAAAPGIPIMIHLDNGGNNALYREWFDHWLELGGEDFEIIGLSYYPFWHGPLSGLRDNLADIAARYGKDLIVCETSMGFTLEDYADHEGRKDGERKGMAASAKLAAGVEWPMTPQGQKRFLTDLVRMVRGVPGGLGKGVMWWEPAWLPTPGGGWTSPEAMEYIHEPGPDGNEWSNQTLFDYDGCPLPALEALGDL